MQIRAKNLSYYILNITAITNIATVLYDIPMNIDIIEDSFIYPQLVDDNVTNNTSRWPLFKEATIGLNIICKQNIDRQAWELPEDILMSIIDVINENIVSTNCKYIDKIDWLSIIWIREWSISPIGYINNRPSVQKNYLIKYSAKNENSVFQ